MKYSDKYPAPDDGGAGLPPAVKVAGLHPLVWVCIVVMGIVGFAAFDHLEDANWDFGTSKTDQSMTDD